MAYGTYNNPRAGSNGSKSRMQRLTDKYVKNLEKSGEGEDGGLSNNCLLYTSPSPRD